MQHILLLIIKSSISILKCQLYSQQSDFFSLHFELIVEIQNTGPEPAYPTQQQDILKIHTVICKSLGTPVQIILFLSQNK